jgi:hypothetical protein
MITSFTVATDDPNIANYSNQTMPGGFVFGLAGGNWINQGVQTAHGGFSLAPLEMSLATVTFTSGAGVLVGVGPGNTISFGFNNPNTYQDAEWTASGAGTQWASQVAGPFSFFTDGPVHAPSAVPEPASMLAVGSALLGLALARRWRSSR